MPAPQDVSKHYTHGNLTAAISAGVRSLGKTINSVSIQDDWAPVDEFHIGGRQATVGTFSISLVFRQKITFSTLDVALAAPRDFLPPGINVELLGSI